MPVKLRTGSGAFEAMMHDDVATAARLPLCKAWAGREGFGQAGRHRHAGQAAAAGGGLPTSVCGAAAAQIALLAPIYMLPSRQPARAAPQPPAPGALACLGRPTAALQQHHGSAMGPHAVASPAGGSGGALSRRRAVAAATAGGAWAAASGARLGSRLQVGSAASCICHGGSAVLKSAFEY